MIVEKYRQDRFNIPMLCRLYIEALLVDEDLADQAWEAWDRGEIDDELAAIAWLLLAA